jgi:hypothetical protein
LGNTKAWPPTNSICFPIDFVCVFLMKMDLYHRETSWYTNNPFHFSTS